MGKKGERGRANAFHGERAVASVNIGWIVTSQKKMNKRKLYPRNKSVLVTASRNRISYPQVNILMLPVTLTPKTASFSFIIISLFDKSIKIY